MDVSLGRRPPAVGDGLRAGARPLDRRGHGAAQPAARPPRRRPGRAPVIVLAAPGRIRQDDRAAAVGRHRRPAGGWVSLDASDDDPARLAGAVARALQAVPMPAATADRLARIPATGPATAPAGCCGRMRELRASGPARPGRRAGRPVTGVGRAAPGRARVPATRTVAGGGRVPQPARARAGRPADRRRARGARPRGAAVLRGREPAAVRAPGRVRAGHRAGGAAPHRGLGRRHLSRRARRPAGLPGTPGRAARRPSPGTTSSSPTTSGTSCWPPSRPRASGSCCGPRSWSGCPARCATRCSTAAARRSGWPTPSAAACSSSGWTGTASGTATTGCSGRCCCPSCADGSPARSSGCTGARRPGTSGRAARSPPSPTPWPAGTS